MVIVLVVLVVGDFECNRGAEIVVYQKLMGDWVLITTL